MQHTNSLFFIIYWNIMPFLKKMMSSTAVWQLSLAFLTVPSGFFIVFVKVPRRSPRNSFVNPFT